MISKAVYNVDVHFKGHGWDTYQVIAEDTPHAVIEVLNRVFNECGYDVLKYADYCRVENVCKIANNILRYDIIVYGDKDDVYYELTELNTIY